MMLKILCLHGFTQTGTTFRSKTGALRQALKNTAEFVFLDAPHIIPFPAKEDGEVSDSRIVCSERRTWWFTASRPQHDEQLPGLEESLECIIKIIREQGPFNGILGFSQGSALTALVLMTISGLQDIPQMKFAILVSGFKTQSPRHADQLDASKIAVPSLHVVGRSDQWVATSKTVALSLCFEDPEFLYHEGGHFVPNGREERTEIVEFISRFSLQ